MSVPELKACPFCGGPAELKHTDGSYGYYPGKWGVGCVKCGIRTKAFHDEEWSPQKGTYSIREQARVSAVEVWNRRAS